jgi:hypothetical protein
MTSEIERKDKIIQNTSMLKMPWNIFEALIRIIIYLALLAIKKALLAIKNFLSIKTLT